MHQIITKSQTFETEVSVHNLYNKINFKYQKKIIHQKEIIILYACFIFKIIIYTEYMLPNIRHKSYHFSFIFKGFSAFIKQIAYGTKK